MIFTVTNIIIGTTQKPLGTCASSKSSSLQEVMLFPAAVPLCIKAQVLQVIFHASRSQARMSLDKPIKPELRYRGDIQKPVNLTQSKCEEIPPNYTEIQTNPANPTSEQSEDKEIENLENNDDQQSENNRQENNVSISNRKKQILRG